MNYYPNNLYGNFGYGNMYSQYPQIQGTPQQPAQPSLQGKIVDGEAVVKATEIPFGGFGVFPKADFSEVYIKTWNNNGTTDILTFKPAVSSEQEANNSFNILLEKLNEIENRLNNFMMPMPVEQQPKIDMQKKGVNLNVY